MHNSHILFAYPDFYPVNSGHKVHGYNIAKGLVNNGYTLYSLNKNADGLTTSAKKGITNKIKAIFKPSIYYIRVSYNWNWVILFYLGKLLNKKIIFELNAPPDELVKYQKSIDKKKGLKILDDRLRHYLSKADKIIVVSEPLKEYCLNILNIQSDLIRVINNGGEKLVFDCKNLNSEFILKSDSLNRYQSVFIWCGSINPLQGYDELSSIANELDEESALVIVADKDNFPNSALKKSNVFIYIQPSRDELAYLYDKSHFGLTLYKDDYSWSRIGFYQSSLKFYEYLANNLVVVIPSFAIGGTIVNVFTYDSHHELMKLIKSTKDIKITNNNSVKREWSEVVQETMDELNKL